MMKTNILIFSLLMTVSGLSGFDADSISLMEIQQGNIKSLSLLSNNQLPKKVIVSIHSGNYSFVQKVLKIVKGINSGGTYSPVKVHLIADSSGNIGRYQRDLIEANGYQSWVEINPRFTCRDPWQQDWGEIAVTMVEGKIGPQLTVLDSNRGRELAKLPAILADMWDCYFMKNPSSSFSKGDYGGNIETTPDGVLVVGDKITSTFKGFLLSHGYQNKHVVLESNWLGVGHVDEYISFVPNRKAPGGYSLVVADPGLALELIRSATDDELDQIGPSRENQLFNAGSYRQILRSIREGGEKSLVALNEEVGRLVERNIERLKGAVLKANPDREKEFSVMRWPTLFTGSQSGSDLYSCKALMPGVVNMLVLRNHLIVPDSYFPKFNEVITNRSNEIGLQPHFVDDMMYHSLQGEIHCGTNIVRDAGQQYVTPEALEKGRKVRDTFNAVHHKY